MTSLILPPGVPGPYGPAGPAGPGVPAGGALGTLLLKKSATDYDTQWITEYLDPIYTYNGIANISTQPPSGNFTVDTAPGNGVIAGFAIHETDAAGQSRFNQVSNIRNGDNFYILFPGGLWWRAEVIAAFGWQGSAPNRWAYGNCIFRDTQGAPSTGQVATIRMEPGWAVGAPRIAAEVLRTANSAAIATAQTVLQTTTLTPLTNRRYYWKFSCSATASVSLFITLQLRLTNAAGTLYGQVIFVQSNPGSALQFDATIPITLMPTGSPITLALCSAGNTGTHTWQGATTTTGVWQMLEAV